MPDTRRHRGPHPRDAEWFAAGHHARLRQATADLSWLLTHGYAGRSSLKLVGDRFALVERQRRAVMRSACSDEALGDRRARQIPTDKLADRSLTIDGFNLLTTIEAALAGGVLLRGRDGCLRDMASMHGSYRRVEQTRPALQLVGEFACAAGVAGCRWWLDRPVSNSGRLQSMIREVARQSGWNWEVQLLPDPDGPLQKTDQVIVTADSAVLDGCGLWHNLAAELVAASVPSARIVDLQDRFPGDQSG